MILDQIALKNFGIFGGRQEAALAPTDDRKPIILFGGLNAAARLRSSTLSNSLSTATRPGVPVAASLPIATICVT